MTAMMKFSFLPALLFGGLLLSSCKSDGEAPQPTPAQPKEAFDLAFRPNTPALTLSLQATSTTPDAFVDLNSNGVKDAGEAVGTTATRITLPAGTRDVKVYGSYALLDLTGLPVTRIEGAGLASLHELRLAGTSLGQEELAKIVAALGLTATSPRLVIEEYRLDSRVLSFVENRRIALVNPEGEAIDATRETLILRVPAGLQTQGISYELEGADLWLDKNLNGKKEADEAITRGGGLILPAGASGESIYLFHGKITSFTIYQPSSDPGEDDGDEDEDEGDEDADEARALPLSAEAKTLTLDASRAKSLQFIFWDAPLSLGEVNLRGAKELRNVELATNPVEVLLLPEESNLRVFKLRGHQLRRLDLSKQSHLQQFLLVRGALTEVTFGRHDELQQLTLSGNQLETLTLPHLPALTLLSAEKNKLRTLQLSTEKSYEYLTTCSLADNQLSSLDLTRLVKTQLIDLSRNPLTHLQLPHDLKELRVAGTKLSELRLNPQTAGVRAFIQKLDASDCAELQLLEASQCSLLSEIKLAHCPKLTPEKLSSALPRLSIPGTLYYDQKLSEGQRTALTALGWTVK